ncbi:MULTISPECIES: hypothetical protein [unclassified Minwuia]|uniref:DUF7946 domain-containing protein n=1 Tax=unclassified Minwuia TaxID=2618799 RepID=UPI002478D688|nr:MULTISPECIES: hypothetical protein [unclassified Minwuia]
MVSIVPPLQVSCTGRDADHHHIEIRQLAKSLDGVGRLSSSILGFYLQGEVRKDYRAQDFRIYTGPPQENGVLFEIFALMNSSQLPLYAPMLVEVGESFLPWIWSAVVGRGSGDAKLTEKALDMLDKQAERHDAFANVVHAGQMRDKAWMQEQITALTHVNRTALRELPAPVGHSCNDQVIYKNSVSPTIIDEPVAQALRSKGEMEVADEMETTMTIRSLNLDTGTGSADWDGEEGGRISIKVTDPALALPKNVYSGSLDGQIPIAVTAKPVLKDGEISRLYVSDARAK